LNISFGFLHSVFALNACLRSLLGVIFQRIYSGVDSSSFES